MKDFIEKFADVLECEAADLTPETKFRELEDWDSIAGLSVIGMVDEEYGVTFNAEDMKACQTIGDLFERMQTKK